MKTDEIKRSRLWNQLYDQHPLYALQMYGSYVSDENPHDIEWDCHLGEAVLWSEMPQGDEYWANIEDNIFGTEIDEGEEEIVVGGISWGDIFLSRNSRGTHE